jgi:two-component system, chemotaxis family, protein-glutamate methylesterase/glutaminase
MINAERVSRDIIAIGASAGGVEALVHLLGRLSRTLPASIGVVLHRSPHHETRLSQVLGRRSALPVLEPRHGQPLEPGTVYVAPRDQHMLFGDHCVSLTRGPKEHHTRPAIDPMFRSAADTYGPRVAGVLLSGMGADGASGLIAIKQRGGLSLVQSPRQAAFPVMIQHALAEDDVDAVLDIEGLAEVLGLVATGKSVAEVSSTSR